MCTWMQDICIAQTHTWGDYQVLASIAAQGKSNEDDGKRIWIIMKVWSSKVIYKDDDTKIIHQDEDRRTPDIVWSASSLCYVYGCMHAIVDCICALLLVGMGNTSSSHIVRKFLGTLRRVLYRSIPSPFYQCSTRQKRRHRKSESMDGTGRRQRTRI
jgi:hypothetical protein